MKTRAHDWVDTHTLRTKHGIQVYHKGRWCNACVGPRPLLFNSGAERDAELRKLAAASPSASE